MGDEFRVDPDALRAAAGQLDEHAAEVSSHGATLGASTARAVGRGPLGEVMESVVRRSLRLVTEDLAAAVSKFYSDVAVVMRESAVETERRDRDVRQSLDELARDEPRVPATEPTGADNPTLANRYQPDDFGADYRQADEQMSISARDPMEPDPAQVERGNRGHAMAQNALANRLVELGYRPLSHNPGEPPYDLAWVVDQILWLAEVKSLTKTNEERQLRLALGQVLRYADIVEHRGAVSRPVIMAEREPVDPSWHRLCQRLGVLLLWPERLALLPALIDLGAGVTQ